MEKVVLNGKYGKGKFALVDDEDFEYLNQFSWRVLNNGYIARSEHYYANGKRSCRLILMHRVVMKVDDPKMFVDHKFHNKLDNRKEMLRVCTHQQNKSNTRHTRGISKYKGVTFNYKKWVAQITYKGKTFNLGRFKTEEEAASAYNEKAKELFGEFALINDV
jgi:hypothetical protein